MATIALSAAGMALGGSIGGSILGLSMATIGRAAGAVIGRRIDQQLLGSGSEAVETGRIDRLRLTSAREGTDIPQIYGRMRVPGQVIWASSFNESHSTSGGGKGTAPTPEIATYSYTISMAIGLCEGEISRVGRVWADGTELALDGLNMRVYAGSYDQLPDPKIAAVEGLSNTPAYRGTAYVVLEDLALAQFGNRIPQLTFEVMRAGASDTEPELSDSVTGVALIPGTGEYSLASSSTYMSPSFGQNVGVNLNSSSGKSDFSTSMDALQGELPNCGSVVLVASWFGNDLRCGNCEIKPKVEQKDVDARLMPWTVSGQSRETADRVAYLDEAPVYGGTPTDASVVEAIQSMHARGLKPVFYPFILMEQLAGNSLPDPYSGEVGQAVLPWRGRITSSLAPTLDGSPDGTAAAVAEVAAFMGDATIANFAVNGRTVQYAGPNDWGYRRFILHYAHLCLAAGGVDAFCIGSEMRGLTQIRGPANDFPAVTALRALAADVRTILGPDCKISYAADWTEYHGYQPIGTNDKFFHLDPLWADTNIDFIGIDNYMPLADWRDSDGHADQDAKSIYSLDYLRSNIAGGEGFDWFYPTPEARDSQRRVLITDGEGEPWIWRYKDLKGWWSHPHHDRIDGVRQTIASDWLPGSKPFWFTEFGCAAIDKGANQPNKFLDPKSSESQLPHYSTGRRDDFMQMQYIKAMHGFFQDESHNPIATEFVGRMVDPARMHVWAWDARPYPFFPANHDLWSDGGNYARGHWLNGRATNRSLASIVREICKRSGVTQVDVSDLHGIVRGFTVSDVGSGRAALQPLMLAYGIEVSETNGQLIFRNRDGVADFSIAQQDLALDPEADRSVAFTRASAAELAGRVQLGHLDADGDYEPFTAEALHPDDRSFSVTKSEFPIALTRSEGRQVVERWLQESRLGRDTVNFALPPSRMDIQAGDTIRLLLDEEIGHYRIDRIEDTGVRLVDATRVEESIYAQSDDTDATQVLKPIVSPVPVELLFLDLPLLRGDEVPHAPYVAVGGLPWPGNIALYSSSQDSGYALQELVATPSIIGVTNSPLQEGRSGIWDRQSALDLSVIGGTLDTVTQDALLSGANLMAIGDGTPDNWEILQFQEAVPVAEGRFAIRRLLRGQAGSRGLIPPVWPTGSMVVLLDGSPKQLDSAATSRGVSRHFRYGPATRVLSDPSFQYAMHAFSGNGLRPYPVVHLSARNETDGFHISWKRCTRIDGDLWACGDVPLGEDAEAYTIKIVQDGIIRRVETVTVPNWTYTLAESVTDVGTAPFRLEVSQVSARFGDGLPTSLILQDI